MYDYPQQIEEFLQENFTPSVPENANVKLTTNKLLLFLFRTFPEGCINDYDLNEILLKLGYKRYTYTHEEYIEVKKEKAKVYEIHKEIVLGWCLKSELDLHIEEVTDKTKI